MMVRLVSTLAVVLALTAAAVPPRPKAVVFPPEEGVYRILPDRVVDGDTFAFYWLVPATARLYGIDAPELRGETADAGRKAQEYLRRRLAVISGGGGTVAAAIRGKDKYGRVLVEVYQEDGTTLNQAMVRDGHAVPYRDE